MASHAACCLGCILAVSLSLCLGHRRGTLVTKLQWERGKLNALRAGIMGGPTTAALLPNMQSSSAEASAHNAIL